MHATSNRFIRPAVSALLLSLVLAGCERVNDASAPAPAASAPSAPAVQGPAADRPQGASPPDFTALVDKVGPAVVNVTTRVSARQMPAGVPRDPLLDFFRRFSPLPLPEQEAPSGGIGSGFVIDAEGHILTNAHVVAGADEVTVRLANSKREYKARVLGSDRQTDVALLKVDAKDLPVAPMGDSRKLRTGEWVAAIGSPFGFANSVTAGIVSAKERSLPDETYVPFIQTDVAVNPGNSGGPLLNVRGEVVGINSQIYSRTGGYMGLSFAIPIEVAIQVADQLRKEGRVTRGRLGVSIQEVTEQLAQSFKLGEPRGALITQVEPDGPAAKAGMAPGDVVLRFNGQDVRDASELPRLVAAAKPGSQVPVEVWRGGASQTLTVTVGQSPSTEPPKARTAPTGGADQSGAGRMGVLVSELPPEGRTALGVPYGLVVQEVQGGSDTGLQRGDVILAINGERFANLAEFNQRLAQVPAGTNVALLVRRGDAVLFVPVMVGK